MEFLVLPRPDALAFEPLERLEKRFVQNLKNSVQVSGRGGLQADAASMTASV